MELSKQRIHPRERLACAMELLGGATVVADIGCDHGRLAVWLAKKGRAKKVIAVDNRPLPLAGAKALVRQTACGALVDCRLGDGLGAVAPHEADEIVIAGLSGQTTAGILHGHPWVLSEQVHLVLVPASRHAWLRRWLCQQGFAVETEVPVLEKGRCYTVISARYTGKCFEPDDFFCQMGLLAQSQDKAAVRVYATARLRHLHKQADGLSGAALLEQQRLISEVEACLQ